MMLTKKTVKDDNDDDDAKEVDAKRRRTGWLFSSEFPKGNSGGNIVSQPGMRIW